MSAQVGIPNYKDLINSAELASLKEKINLIALNYAKMASNEAIENRENESFDVYTAQYTQDLIYLKNICSAAQELVNKCNDTLFDISCKAIGHHVYFYEDENKGSE